MILTVHTKKTRHRICVWNKMSRETRFLVSDHPPLKAMDIIKWIFYIVICIIAWYGTGYLVMRLIDRLFADKPDNVTKQTKALNEENDTHGSGHR